MESEVCEVDQEYVPVPDAMSSAESPPQTRLPEEVMSAFGGERILLMEAGAELEEHPFKFVEVTE